jgi:predicted MFS family arabinose efflux permease
MPEGRWFGWHRTHPRLSGLSRSVSNLGSSLGTAIAGTILASGLTRGAYAAALLVLAAFGLLGLAAAIRLPRS